MVCVFWNTRWLSLLDADLPAARHRTLMIQSVGYFLWLKISYSLPFAGGVTSSLYLSANLPCAWSQKGKCKNRVHSWGLVWASISLPFSPMSVACTIDSRVMLYYLCLEYLRWKMVGRVPSSPHKACSSLGMRFREGHVKVTMCKQMFVAEVYCVCVCYFPPILKSLLVCSWSWRRSMCPKSTVYQRKMWSQPSLMDCLGYLQHRYTVAIEPATYFHLTDRFHSFRPTPLARFAGSSEDRALTLYKGWRQESHDSCSVSCNDSTSTTNNGTTTTQQTNKQSFHYFQY